MMSKMIKYAALLLLIVLSSCGNKREKYLTEFSELVETAQFHPAEKTDKDWKKLVDQRNDFLRNKFVKVHADLTRADKETIDSLDGVLKKTVLEYTKNQKVYEAITRE